MSRLPPLEFGRAEDERGQLLHVGVLGHPVVGGDSGDLRTLELGREHRAGRRRSLPVQHRGQQAVQHLGGLPAIGAADGESHWSCIARRDRRWSRVAANGQSKREGFGEEGRGLAKINRDIIVKVPITKEGLKAVKVFAAEGIKNERHGDIFAVERPCGESGRHLHQSVRGAARCRRAHGNGLNGEIRLFTTTMILKRYWCRRRRCGIRNACVLEAALAGSDVCTMKLPSQVMELLYHHPMTDNVIQQFRDDWSKVKQ